MLNWITYLFYFFDDKYKIFPKPYALKCPSSTHFKTNFKIWWTLSMNGSTFNKIAANSLILVDIFSKS